MSEMNGDYLPPSIAMGKEGAASGGEHQTTVNAERDVTAGKNCNLLRLWLES